MKLFRNTLPLVLLLISTAAGAQMLRAGASQVDITPPKGAPLAGYYLNRAATGAHDNLYARALVIDVNGVKVALVACDIVGIEREIIDPARALIAKQTGIAPDHVMISATHTHTGPVIYIEPTRYNLQGELKRIASEYSAALPGKIADSVVQANAALQPAVLRAAVGKEDSLGFNRRYFMKDGTVSWNPGIKNPDVVRSAGPVDTDVQVMYVETPEGKGIASYVNFAVHQDTTGGSQFSADYSYALSLIMRMTKGDGLVSMFTMGCSGNVNHFDAVGKIQRQGYEEAARIGAVLAGDVLKLIQHAPVIPVSQIQVSTRMLKFPVQQFTPEEIAWAKKTQATLDKPNSAPMYDLVRAAKILELEVRHGKPLETEVQVIALGNQIALASFPAEMFAEFGIQLKEDSPYPITIAVELANGEVGYIPNRSAFAEGAYEVISTRFPIGTGEQLTDSALAQLQALMLHQQ
jgi:neutral ceramidase